MSRIYVEDFNDGPGGWFGWLDNFKGPKPLLIRDSAAVTQSPWWIDYNHAPPGAGYLHLPYILFTGGGAAYNEVYTETGGINRFLERGYPTDFRNAKISLRLRGELLKRGAEFVLLIQTNAGGLTSGWLLTGQPIPINENWTDVTIAATLDPTQWTCLKARHNRAKTYGLIPLAQALANVNVDIILTFFPLDVQPMGRIDGDPHCLRAGKDYPVWTSRLPEGYVELDRIQIEFSQD